MILVPRDRLTTLAANFDVPLVIAGHSGHAIVEAQGQSQRIESRPQVGAGGRYPDGHRIAHYLRPAARAAASTSASIRASASTVNPLSAVSVSLSPLPVTVTTIVDPGSSSPPACVSPAAPAAEAGSTKTPS